MAERFPREVCDAQRHEPVSWPYAGVRLVGTKRDRCVETSSQDPPAVPQGGPLLPRGDQRGRRDVEGFNAKFAVLINVWGGHHGVRLPVWAAGVREPARGSDRGGVLPKRDVPTFLTKPGLILIVSWIADVPATSAAVDNPGGPARRVRRFRRARRKGVRGYRGGARRTEPQYPGRAHHGPRSHRRKEGRRAERWVNRLWLEVASRSSRSRRAARNFAA